MIITIEAAPEGGYQIHFKLSADEENIYPETVQSLAEALHYVQILADEVKRETGVLPEPYVTVSAIRENKSRDIHARKAWNTPDVRAKMH